MDDTTMARDLHEASAAMRGVVNYCEALREQIAREQRRPVGKRVAEALHGAVSWLHGLLRKVFATACATVEVHRRIRSSQDSPWAWLLRGLVGLLDKPTQALPEILGALTVLGRAAATAVGVVGLRVLVGKTPAQLLAALYAWGMQHVG